MKIKLHKEEVVQLHQHLISLKSICQGDMARRVRSELDGGRLTSRETELSIRRFNEVSALLDKIGPYVEEAT